MNESASSVITTDQLQKHWQGHRALTRRVIEAFPEESLFEFSVGGMRPFSVLAIEMIGMAEGGIRGLATRKWPAVQELLQHSGASAPRTRRDLLERWDRVTADIDRLWPEIPPGRFQEVDKAFAQWESQMINLFLYLIDNEIHHRGQGYVYLRALGIEPPPFYER
jgi:uncharacterized damage-inducible protein DinB